MPFNIAENTTSYFINNKIDLPRFQRKATWKDIDNFKLCISVFKGYPIGVIIVNETGTKKFLLDGRQRRNALTTMYNDPVAVYTWATKFLGITPNIPDESVRSRFYEKIREYLQTEFHKSTESKEELDEHLENNDDSETSKTFDAETQSENMRALLDLILLVHNKVNRTNRLAGMFKFNKIIPIEDLAYADYENGEFFIDHKKLKRFIREVIANGDTDQTSFLKHLVKRYRLQESAAEKLKNYLEVQWEYFEKCFETIRKTDEIIVNAQIGLIRLIDASPLDAQNIFSLVNGQGAALTAEELLSSRPFWNVEIQNPTDEIKSAAKELYNFLEIDVPSNVVRWDVCATLLSRIDRSNLIFTKIELSDKKTPETLFTRKLTLGFKLWSAIIVGGITSNSVKDLENEKKCTVDWNRDVEIFIKKFNMAMDMLYDCDYFKYLMAWKQSIMSLMGNSVALEFATLVFKKWIELGEPIRNNTPKLKEYQKSAIILCDRLLYEHGSRLWTGSADSRMARDLAMMSERFKVVSYEEWETLINNFATGKNAKVEKGIIYHYYCLKKMRPSCDGDGANATYEIDHIYPQARFANVTTIDSALMESLGNKALLPKLDNIAKSNKTLSELKGHPWLFSEVKRVTGIDDEDIDKYSDIVNIEELINLRIGEYKSVFKNERNSLLNN
ncbi:MAG: DUF262 domain-containing protein [Bacteroidales bacterium]|nr:DUF262 domain-containing protein [Bacteroidales bacterium]